jgi:hypothetical protein
MSAVDTTENLVGEREDLTDILTVITPDEAPLWSTLKKTKASMTLHEWQTITLAAAAENAQLEGFEASFTASTASTRVNNYCQIFNKTIEVSETALAVNFAGRADEFAFQTELRMKELVRDIERAIIQQTATAGGASGARKMRGMIAWLTSNTLTAGSAATVQTTLTEARYNALLEDIFDNGGFPNAAYCNGFTKRAISAFTSPGTRNISTDDARLVANVDVYQSDFGTQVVILDRHVPKSVLLILDESMFTIPMLRAPKMGDIAKTGDGRKGSIVAELTLASLNELASGRYMGLLTA